MTDFKEAVVQTTQEAILTFLNDAAAVDDPDYGDCMREWNHELLALRQIFQDSEISQEVSPWALEKLLEMQNYVQFNPNWDVDSTRERLLKDASEIQQHLLLAEDSGRSA